MTEEVEYDIRAGADRVVSIMGQRRYRDAMTALEAERQGRPLVVQESLDRLVANHVSTHLDVIRRTLDPTGERDAGIRASLERVIGAKGMPRFPASDELTGLSEAQRHDIYASIVDVRGNEDARDAMGRTDQRVLLGLRQENSTVASATRDAPSVQASDNPRTPDVDESRRGTGVYDDRIVVLWRDAQGGRHVHEVNRANTEPTAQYDAHAQPGAGRAWPYESVRHRRIEGDDANGDEVRDLGRMAQGTVAMALDTHQNPRLAGTNRAFRPIREYADQVQRDTNADGWFTAADLNGVQDLNRTFKIHSGSLGNTDSAGCQTVHPNDYMAFMDAARGNPTQTRWQYVLTNTTPGMFRDVVLGEDQDRAMGRDQVPQRPPVRGGVPPVRDEPPLPERQQQAPRDAPGHGVPAEGGRHGIGNHRPFGALELLGTEDREIYDRAYSAVLARGGYGEEQMRNIAAAGVLAFRESRTTLAADDVGVYGDRLRTTYMPHGPGKEPNFAVDVTLTHAAAIPAERSLQQAEAIAQVRVQEESGQHALSSPEQPRSGPSIGARSLS